MRLACDILADSTAEDALAVIDAWIARHGIPEPTPLPHGDYDAEILHIRMRVTHGTAGQLFWTTAADPTFNEAKTDRFVIQPDDEFHEYRLDLSSHPLWSNQTITALRLDPVSGNGRGGHIEIDSIRAE